MICKGDDSMFITSIANVSGKRVKKSVQRLSEVYDKVFETNKDRKKVTLGGSGVKLGEIERVKEAYQRGKVNKEMSKNIHWLCYKTLGQAVRRNSDIRQYNGFDKDDEYEVKKRLTLSEKMKVESLKVICDLFNIPTTGKQKKDVCIGLVDFLKCPIETGSKVFRKSALRPRTKTKKSGGRDKAVGVKNRISSGDVEMHDQEIDSLSDIDSEEIVITKTKRLQHLEGTMEDVLRKDALSVDKNGEGSDTGEISDMKDIDGKKDNINVDKESNINRANVKATSHEDQIEINMVKAHKENVVGAKEKVHQEKQVKTKKRVHDENAVGTQEKLHDGKKVKTKERVHGEKVVKTKETAHDEKKVKTKQRVHGENVVSTKERAHGEKKAKTKERVHGEKVVKTKERAHDESKVKSEGKIVDTKNFMSKEKVDAINMVTTKVGGTEGGDFGSHDISDADFKVKIAEILKSADINSTTLNQVCDKVTALFPNVDLVSQRQHIKQLIKKVIDES